MHGIRPSPAHAQGFSFGYAGRQCRRRELGNYGYFGGGGYYGGGYYGGYPVAAAGGVCRRSGRARLRAPAGLSLAVPRSFRDPYVYGVRQAVASGYRPYPGTTAADAGEPNVPRCPSSCPGQADRSAIHLPSTTDHANASAYPALRNDDHSRHRLYRAPCRRGRGRRSRRPVGIPMAGYYSERGARESTTISSPRPSSIEQAVQPRHSSRST